MEVGDIVTSLAGHDTNESFVVIAAVNDKFVLIADGKGRGMQNPKLKRIKHLRVVGKSGINDPTNATLKKCLKKFNGTTKAQ